MAGKKEEKVSVVFWCSGVIVATDEKSTFAALILCHSLRLPKDDKCAVSFVVQRLAPGRLAACSHATRGMLPLRRLIACAPLPRPALPIPKIQLWLLHPFVFV